MVFDGRDRLVELLTTGGPDIDQTLGMTVADQRPAAYWSSTMPRLEVAMEVDAPRMLRLFATRVLT